MDFWEGSLYESYQIFNNSNWIYLCKGGGYAEYVAVHEDHICLIPESLSYIEAAAIPEAWLTAFQLLFFVGNKFFVVYTLPLNLFNWSDIVIEFVYSFIRASKTQWQCLGSCCCKWCWHSIASVSKIEWHPMFRHCW